MARQPRKPKQTTQAAALVAALGFVSVAASRDNVIGSSAKHVRMFGKQVVAFDGQIAAGHPIEEELTLCPHIDHLAKALARSGKSLVISETPAGRLSVKGEKLTALVPCLRSEDVPEVWPDAAIAPVDDRIKAAFKCCGTLASESGDRLVEASLLLRGGDCTGTNGAAILQFWHGNDLPPNMVLPKVFCKAVAEVKNKLTGFGASFSPVGKVLSVTFHFEGGGWLKTICYADEWPLTDQLWLQPNYQDVPEGLFEAIDTVDDFHERGNVFFADNAVQSHRSVEVGAQYKVPGLQGGKTFAGKLMKQVAPFASKIDLNTFDDRVFFLGGEAETPVRGIVMCILENAYIEPRKDPEFTDPYSQTMTAEQVAEAFAQHNAPASEPTFAAQMTGDDNPPSQGGWTSPAAGGGFTSPGEYEIDDDIPF